MGCNQVIRPGYNFTYTLPVSTDNECAIQLPGIGSNTLILIEVIPLAILDSFSTQQCTGSIVLVNGDGTLYTAELCKNGVLQSIKIFYWSRLNFTLHVQSAIRLRGKFVKIGLQLL